jgi:hypothetical protein
MLKILSTTLLSLALIATQPAAAQGLPGQHGGGYPPVQQQGAFSAQQFLLGTWAIETNLGAEVATYMPDGTVNGMVRLRKRPQPMPFQGRWSVRPLGADRFELTVSAFGQRASNTLRMLPDGTLFNETARAIAYRVY